MGNAEQEEDSEEEEEEADHEAEAAHDEKPDPIDQSIEESEDGDVGAAETPDEGSGNSAIASQVVATAPPLSDDSRPLLSMLKEGASFVGLQLKHKSSTI